MLGLIRLVHCARGSNLMKLTKHRKLRMRYIRIGEAV